MPSAESLETVYGQRKISQSVITASQVELSLAVVTVSAEYFQEKWNCLSVSPLAAELYSQMQFVHTPMLPSPQLTIKIFSVNMERLGGW